VFAGCGCLVWVLFVFGFGLGLRVFGFDCGFLSVCYFVVDIGFYVLFLDLL